MRRLVFMVVLAAGGVLAVAASQPPADKPLMAVGKRYVCLFPGETKRVVEPVAPPTGNWVRCKYTHSDGVERTLTLNLGQVVYFQPADE